MIKYVGPVIIYKVIDLHNHLLMMLDGKILRGLFEHERIKPAIIRTDQGNVHNLVQLKQIINAGLSVHINIPIDCYIFLILTNNIVSNFVIV